MSTSVIAAGAYFALYTTQILAGPLFMPPLELSRPICTKYTGRFTFLTYQTNLIGTLFFGANLLHTLGLVDATFVLVHGFPLVFAMSVFLTVAYYGLDHFQPANRACREEWEQKGW